MQIQKQVLSVLLLAIAFFLASGCGERGSAISVDEQDSAALADFPDETAADVAWRALFLADDYVPDTECESTSEPFGAAIELARHKLREQGRRFWDAFPNDERRYDWLVLTTHLQPTCVQNLEEWSPEYQKMRQVFWAADEVSDRERRFLWFGELRLQIWQLREAAGHRESAVQRSLLNDLTDFVSEFPEPESEADRSEYRYLLRELIGDMVEYQRSIGFSNEDLAAFLAQLFVMNRYAESEYSNAVTFRILKHADRDSLSTFLGSFRALNAQEQPSTRRELAKLALLSDLLEVEGSKSSDLARRWQSLQEYPRDQSDTYLGGLVFWHAREVLIRQSQEAGFRLFVESAPDISSEIEEIVGWIEFVNQNPADFSKNVIYASHRRAVGLEPGFDDETAREEWAQKYASIRRTVWESPRLSEMHRARIRAAELIAALSSAEQAWSKSQDKKAVHEALGQLHEFIEKYGASGNNALSEHAKRWASYVLHNASNFGLDNDDLLRFFEPMREHAEQGLRQLAHGAINMIELRKAPFVFTSLTMNGEEFDIADYRGQIVLVEHWTSSCASCIAAMPRIYGVYLEYQSRGFEVVSIAYDGTRNRQRVLRLEKELGLSWVTVNGEGLLEQISKRYGYAGVPQYMLLNRDGTLHAGTREVDMGRNLEVLLEEMFAEEAEEKTVSGIH